MEKRYYQPEIETMSVEEIKKLYKEKGYSVVAFTDHDVFLQHNDLTDGEFLALNGYEMEINQKKIQITLEALF